MSKKNFINFHALISHSASCLNRDDMNMQKTLIFGGKTRVRISSQSLKRAMRTSGYYREHLGESSVRTAVDLEENLEYFKKHLQGQEALKKFDENCIERAVRWMLDSNEKKTKKKSNGESDADNDLLASGDNKPKKKSKLVVTPWVIAEISYVCSRIVDGATKGDLKKEIKSNSIRFREALQKAVDIALSGRMATSGLLKDLCVDGALALAHAFTTHIVEPQDLDWFTAVDDLNDLKGKIGAGHLNTQQFSAGVFYRYGSLNLKQLQFNLGLIDRMTDCETAESRQSALEIARHVLHLFATVVPEAKQQAFGAHNLASLILVSFSDLPLSLANAFEIPADVEAEGGYLLPSVNLLLEHWKKTNQFYNLDERVAVGSLKELEISYDGLQVARTLLDMEQWVLADGYLKN